MTANLTAADGLYMARVRDGSSSAIRQHIGNRRVKDSPCPKN